MAAAIQGGGAVDAAVRRIHSPWAKTETPSCGGYMGCAMH